VVRQEGWWWEGGNVIGQGAGWGIDVGQMHGALWSRWTGRGSYVVEDTEGLFSMVDKGE
jgi:hypothetical protein